MATKPFKGVIKLDIRDSKARLGSVSSADRAEGCTERSDRSL